MGLVAATPMAGMEPVVEGRVEQQAGTPVAFGPSRRPPVVARRVARGDAGEQAVALGAYLRARAAIAEPRVAAREYAVALSSSSDPVVAIRAYRTALLVGNRPLAERAAAILRAADAAPADAALVPLAAAARAADPTAAGRAAAALAGTPLDILSPAIAAWLGFAVDRTVAKVGAADPVARRLQAEARALLLIADGQTDEGLAAVTATGVPAPIDLRIAAASLLFAQGRDPAARGLLAGDDPVLARLRSGAPAQATLGFGIARLFARVAGDLSGEDTVPLRIALTRAALIADPELDRARLLLAAALADVGEPDLALIELGLVSLSGAWGPAASDARATVLEGAGRTAEALALAEVQAGPGGPAAWERYAALLVRNGRAADAVPWYRRLVEGPDARDWTSWMSLGNALDAAGRWPEARAALDRAVALAPDQPLASNNAGYARLEHGEQRDGARLIKRASRLAPDDASIADSLGWAYHLGGDSARALPLIERAARAQPANAEISDHLGDVYWRLGRRYEARYAWAAARLLASDEQGRAIAAKIEGS